MIIKLPELLTRFEAITANRQTDCVEHLLKKAGTKLDVYNHHMNKVLITTNWDKAYDKAFCCKGQTGHFQTNTNLNFYKPTGSLVLRTKKDLFLSLIEYLNISPNVVYKELQELKLIW